MMAVTGDLVDGSVGRLARHTEPLGRLRARYGSFFVTGNHEYYCGAHAWIVEMRRLGLSVLLNEHVVLKHFGESVVVAGVTDLSAHHFDPAHRSNPVSALAGAPEEAAVKVLLAHQPRSAFAAAKAGSTCNCQVIRTAASFSLESCREAVRTFSAGLHVLRALALRQSWHRLLGPPSALARPPKSPISSWYQPEARWDEYRYHLIAFLLLHPHSLPSPAEAVVTFDDDHIGD